MATHNAVVDREGDLVNVGDYTLWLTNLVMRYIHFSLMPSPVHA